MCVGTRAERGHSGGGLTVRAGRDRERDTVLYSRTGRRSGTNSRPVWRAGLCASVNTSIIAYPRLLLIPHVARCV